MQHINEALIGKPGSRRELCTPALVLDLDAFERNVAGMADHCRAKGIALRPHAKTHKSLRVAKAQIAAGAVGICCAKLGEAEAMVQEAAGGPGVDSILLTSPVVAPRGIARLMALNARVPDLMVVADNPANAVALDDAAGAAGKPLKVVVDIDVGLHRTGIAPGDRAVALAEQIAAAPSLEFMGLQAYAGHLMHVEEFNERKEKSLAAMDLLAGVRDALRDRGIECAILTGGGTGTYNIDPDAHVLTELQGGSYVFMDRQYNDVALANGQPMPFETALGVQMTVISNNTPGIVTTDAGFKSFATDADPPVLLDGAPEGASYFFFGDEQGGIVLPDKETDLPLGSVVTAITPHCDPTVNLYECYHVVRGDALVDIWPIEARGRAA